MKTYTIHCNAGASFDGCLSTQVKASTAIEALEVVWSEWGSFTRDDSTGKTPRDEYGVKSFTEGKRTTYYLFALNPSPVSRLTQVMTSDRT